MKDIISTTSSHPHPVIYLRGFRDTDLNSIIDFMYCGEANVLESDVERFLDSAKDLKVDNVIDLYLQWKFIGTLKFPILKGTVFLFRFNVF